MELKERFYYDETSSTCLRWNITVLSGRHLNQVNVSVGDVAGGYSPGSGYYQVRVEGKLKLVHRVIWEMFNGEIPDGMFVDHKDQDKLNNRISNLRLVTKAGNNQNQNQKLRVDSTSGVVGVNKLINTLKSGNKAEYWRAVWFDGKVKSKSFSVKTYGEDEAFRLACEYREQIIKELNENGACYTDLHGKPKTICPQR